MPKRKNQKKKHTNFEPAGDTKKQKRFLVVDVPSEGGESSISKLNDHCSYEVFDWLPLKDVNSFAKTSQWSQQAAGNYFQLNYSASEVYYSGHILASEDGDVDGLRKFITNISFYGTFMKQYYDFESSSDAAYKQIIFKDVRLSANKIKCIKNALTKVEAINMVNCAINGEFYDTILKFCTNLKSLRIEFVALGNVRDHVRPEVMMGTDNNWLRQKYPKLEHLELAHKASIEMDELKVFFAQNPNVRSLAMNDVLLRANGHLFLTTNIKLDRLAVQCYLFYCDNHLQLLFSLLNELHAHGFYQRLHLYTGPTYTGLIASLKGLEKLFLQSYRIDHALPPLVGLKELGLNANKHKFDRASLETIANTLVALERLSVYYVNSVNDVLPFIQRSTKLRTIRIRTSVHGNTNEIMNLPRWNEEREKLAGAFKVTIYVDEDIYLATKWATNKTNYDFVEIKRLTSYEWHNDFEFNVVNSQIH